MQFNWVPFTETNKSFAARITVRQTGQFGFTSGAINCFKIKDRTYAYLFFDPQRRAVGIKLSDDNGRGAIQINKKNDSNVHLRAKNFCDKHKIPTDKARRFELKEDKAGEMLYFCLDDGEDEPEEEAQTNTDSDTFDDDLSGL
jgi:hypothetical protein